MAQIKIQNDSGDKDFFTIIPNYIANHSTANDQSLYLQMKRYAGENGKCFATEKTLMKKMKIGKKAYNKSLNYLLDKGWISFIGMTRGKTRPIKTYKINNIWKLNNDHYKKISSESTLSYKKISSESKADKFQKHTKISSESTIEEEPVLRRTNNNTRLASPTDRKLNKFKKKDYEEILDIYQDLKGIELKGQEFSPCQQAIKTMFLSGRSVNDIAACMRWFAESQEEWTQNWTINTIKMKLPEFLAGKLKSKNTITADDIKVPEYAKAWQRDYKK